MINGTITFNEFERFDPEMASLIRAEENRQRTTLSLIPSENVSSPYAKALEGCLFADKNAEGYPGMRVAAGCEYADSVEQLAVERLRKIFGCEHANVQPMSATVGNAALLNAVLSPGDSILSMQLCDGGHLSHGAPFHVSGKIYKAAFYTVDAESQQIDLDSVAAIAEKVRPKMLICGASSYPRLIDYGGFAEVARSVGALLWADIAHVVGLIAAKVIPSPFPHADFVTTSTHKTLRGPRGAGIIMCSREWAKKIDRALFPGLQGAPKMDMIAARATLFKECMTPKFAEYSRAVLENAQALAEGLTTGGIPLVTGGTDIHMLLADVDQIGLSGDEAEQRLKSLGLIVNKNPIPFDTRPALTGSGIRLGSPAVTTRGMNREECMEIGGMVAEVLTQGDDPKTATKVVARVKELTAQYPLFHEKWLP